jgi:ABC-type transporter Mla subunit MlaD
VRTTIGTETEALTAATERAGTVFNAETRRAADDARQILDMLTERAGRFSAEVEAETGRLGSALTESEARVAGVEERLKALRGSGEDAAATLSSLDEQRERLDSGIAALAGALGSVREQMGGDLGELSATRRGEVEALRTDVETLAEALGDLRQRTAEIAEPARAVLADIETGVAALDGSAERMTGSSETLRRELAEAEALLGAVRLQSEDTALEASSKLIEALGRVREVADQAAQSVRSTLGGVVGEAVAALETASGEAVQAAVSGPVRGEIERLEDASRRSADAAQGAAERLSRSLVSVAETAAAVEARVAEANDQFEAAQKRDLSEQSNLLMEALNSHAIDITKAMSAEVTEQSWSAYLGGDRSIFTRRASRLVEQAEVKRVARLFEEEPEFRDGVRQYIADFETMLRRVMQDRQGNSLSVALLSSDVGRLYVALAQATERLRKD